MENSNAISNDIAGKSNLNEQDFELVQRISMAMYKSQCFSDIKNVGQAVVKVMAGNEIGLPPFASMSGIHIIQGKPVLGANVIATLLSSNPNYKYRVVTSTDSECEIDFYEKINNKFEKCGTASFDINEAKNAELLSKDNWRKYPSDMLFARCISRGARRFSPAIFGGSPIYTPEEMGCDIDEDGNVIQEKNNNPIKKVKPRTTYKEEAELANMSKMSEIDPEFVDEDVIFKDDTKENNNVDNMS